MHTFVYSIQYEEITNLLFPHWGIIHGLLLNAEYVFSSLRSYVYFYFHVNLRVIRSFLTGKEATFEVIGCLANF